MSILCSSVGRKVLMAVTGVCLALFLVVHLLGNLSVFAGPDGINAYAEKLHSLGAFVWVFRAAIAALLAVHVWFGITLTLENSAANPAKYAVSRKLKATFSSETMIWTGLVVLAFLVYHILHFTARMTPDIVKDIDLRGRFDVYKMVTASFHHGAIALAYTVGIAALFLHLRHGLQSLFQTFGVVDDKSLPKVDAGGKTVSAVFLVGYCVIPLFILFGLFAR
jgi:succinate dehydrogenase / fumarate reductase cytochrome b subunit